MRSLRSRLFLAILGAVLLAVGASLALGIVLTKDAVRDSIKGDVENQAEAVAAQARRLPGSSAKQLRLPAPALPPPAPAGGGVAGGDATRLGGPPGAGEQGGGPTLVVSLAAASRVLPDSAVADLERDGAASGSAEIGGDETIYAARRVGSSAVVATRPDVVSGDDFSRYLSALLIAAGAAALLAAALAAVLARRLTQPLRRLGQAAGEVAAGGHPEPVPAEGTEELDELADSFNRMSAQLASARDAERAVLLSVSHDLRTPLTSIRGYAEGIEDGTVEPREAAAIVARESDRLERLVGDLMALARLRQGVMEVRREPVDLGAVAREAEERLRPRAAAAGVGISVGAGGGEVEADRGRLLQVVSNLVENAIRVSPAGGEVELAFPAANELDVRDEGPGIPPGEIDRAFERFHLRGRAGHGSPDGAGLGLAIVHELTEAMGGTVTVENLEAQGARFRLRFPLRALP